MKKGSNREAPEIKQATSTIKTKYEIKIKEYLVILKETAFLISADSLKEVNDYLEENHKGEANTHCAIIDVTNCWMSIMASVKETNELIKKIRTLFE